MRASVNRGRRDGEKWSWGKKVTPQVSRGTLGGGWRDKNSVAGERAKKPVVRVNDSFYEDKRLRAINAEGVVDGAPFFLLK